VIEAAGYGIKEVFVVHANNAYVRNGEIDPIAAHIFTSRNDSLSERIHSYWSVLYAFRNAEASLKHMDSKKWADSLGEKHEVQQAYKISQHSLHMANNATRQSELSQAREQGLMSDEQGKEFTQIKRQQEMQNFRYSQSSSDSNHDSRKR
jgi:hypothetical protein